MGHPRGFRSLCCHVYLTSYFLCLMLVIALSIARLFVISYRLGHMTPNTDHESLHECQGLGRVPPHQDRPSNQGRCSHPHQIPSDPDPDPISLPARSCPPWPPCGGMHPNTSPSPAEHECVREGPRPSGWTGHCRDWRRCPCRVASREEITGKR